MALWKRIIVRSVSAVLGLGLVLFIVFHHDVAKPTASSLAPVGSSSDALFPLHKIVAVYHGGRVTGSEFDQQYKLYELAYGQPMPMTPPYEQEVIDKYIVVYRVLPRLAQQKGFAVNAGQLTAETRLFQIQVGTQVYHSMVTFHDQMNRLGVTQAMLEAFVKQAMYVTDLQNSFPSTVSARQAKIYYESHLQNFTTVTLNQILVKTSAEAAYVHKALVGGGSYSNLAKRFSIDPGSKNNAGLYVGVKASQLVPSVANASMTQPIGFVGNPVHSQYGYHILRIDQRTIQPFAVVHTTINQILAQEEHLNALQKLIRSTLVNAHVLYHLT